MALNKKLPLFFGIFLVSCNELYADSLSVSDGTTVSVDGQTYTTAGPNASDAALYASGAGSKIVGTGLTIEGGTFPETYAVLARAGASIELLNSHITTVNALRVEGTGSSIVMNGGSISNSGNNPAYSIQDVEGGKVTLNDVAYTGSTIHVHGAGSELNLNGGTFSNTTATIRYPAIFIESGGRLNVNNNIINSVREGVLITGDAANRSSGDLKNFAVISVFTGVDIDSYSEVTMQTGTIKTTGSFSYGLLATGIDMDLSGDKYTLVRGDGLKIETTGAFSTAVVGSEATIILTNSNITVRQADGVLSEYGAKISLTGGSVTVNGANNRGGSAIVATGDDSQVSLDGVVVKTVPNASYGLFSEDGGHILVKNSSVSTQGLGSHGLYAVDATAHVENTKIETTGNDAYGVYVESDSAVTMDKVEITTSGSDGHGLVFADTAENSISLSNSSVNAQNGISIFADGSKGTVTLNNSLATSGVQLVSASGGAELNINAGNNTQLLGGATLDATSTINMNLTGNSVWTIKPPASGLTSTVTSLNLDNSSVNFVTPQSTDYQTLVTSGLISNAGHIGINTYLNEGGALSDQQTDRVLVNGDVAGTAIVNIIVAPDSPGGITSEGQNLANEGISIIQVSGNAAENSFQLRNGYVTANGLPYEYRLYAYGPGSANGLADDGQRLVDGSGYYWDYRLQSSYAEPSVRQVVPQVASYLVAPEALFQAGLLDIGSLHKRLGEIRQGKGGDSTQSGEFFIRAYGGTYDYSSNLNASRYGYDADIQYAALQAGGNLYAFETKDSITRFGLSGSYGEISFEPKHVYGSKKNDIHKWAVSAYATYQHTNGFYVDGVLSYGGFDGSISTKVRDRTTGRIKGNSFAVSVETGMPFETAYAGVLVEPQAQIVYQRLMFNGQYDLDNFRVDLGNQDLWTARVGGRLIKIYQPTSEGRVFSAYSKFNLLTSFGDGGTVNLGDDFTLGDFGSSVEGGLGFNAAMTSYRSFYGDIVYQHKIEKAGVTGATFNFGVRSQF